MINEIILEWDLASKIDIMRPWYGSAILNEWKSGTSFFAVAVHYYCMPRGKFRVQDSISQTTDIKLDKKKFV